MAKGDRVEFVCVTCGQKFYTRPSEAISRTRGTLRKYCSLKCSQEARKVPIEDRFWSHVDVRGEDDCWPWTGSVDPKWGYGQVRMENGTERSHRVAFFLTHGYWPNICRHTCDNPPCCNPKHLLDGTHADNARDKVDRGRARGAMGESHPSTKLRANDVIRIRELATSGVTHDAIALEYGIYQSSVSRIVNRTNWKHV